MRKTEFVRDASNLVICALPSSTIVREASAAEHYDALITDKAATVGFQDGSGNFPQAKRLSSAFTFWMLHYNSSHIAAHLLPSTIVLR
jgi:hypothetical protein